MKFVGWIPTVTGHLSFSAIGYTTFPSRTRVFLSEGCTYIYQKRDLLDVVFPYAESSKLAAFFREQFSNFAIGISGSFAFICKVYEPRTGEDLCGTVYLIPPKLNRSKIKSILKKLSSEEKITKENANSIELKCGEVSTFSCRFKLNRNGKLLLELIANNAIHQNDAEIENLVANQFFYFLKDICHTHQHHDPDHDAITQVTKISDDEDTWINETRRSLYRSVINYKKSRKEKSLYRASGILAYTRAFEKSHCETLSENEKIRSEHLERSLDVSRQEMQHFDQKKIATVETAKGFFFALFGFIISATLIARSDPNFKVDSDPIYKATLEFVASQPVLVLVGVGLISVTYSMWTHKIEPGKFVLIRTILRLFQGYQRRYWFLANMVVCIFLMFLAYLLI